MDGGLPNKKRWTIIYPIYISSNKTIAEGRRISSSNACENPTCIEIIDCCRHLNVSCDVEFDKAYPRDSMQRGRVRILLKKADGPLCNPAIGSKKHLMFQVAELVPRHPGRAKKHEPSTASTTAETAKSGKGGRKKK